MKHVNRYIAALLLCLSAVGAVAQDSSQSSAACAEVYNVAGQRVVCSDCAAGRTEIDLSALPAGIYVARAAGSAMTMALR